ncbi:phenazine biosynthesis protein, PhzF family [Fulvimarina pelagi HTCC2506]|uniref:Phenazine biosynthesis protein, PhzF family n=1 Tax=Fulvimarina pelagi HTCC2506 TaxID=314231 RepID=Q0G3E8_9HYPH|nr:PhzF family phenazine biosynthesis protein [Fulvimarina pelagi]EAU41883.1 phenazine biosynthesis protein, PhzF family [Fulvimarina pelagi HTCC2506]
MPTLPIYQVDAFTTELFAGNPAAVVPLNEWLPDETLTQIAAENNLAETAYFVPDGENRWELRWFTPAIEVPLCGHATLATAFVLTECLGVEAATLTFATRQSGELTVTRTEDGRFVMRFPARNWEPHEAHDGLSAALGKDPNELFFTKVAGDTSFLAVFDKASDVVGLDPDIRAIAAVRSRNVVATAPGSDIIVTAKGDAGSSDAAKSETIDFVSRMFAPNAGIDEDPVTGSAHCLLAPFWAQRLGKSELKARQVSKRGGDLWCKVDGETVVVSGYGVIYLEGRIRVPG